MNWLDVLRRTIEGGPSATVAAAADLPKPATDAWEYAAWRFARACRTSLAWGPDHAVLLRQVARWRPGLALDVPAALRPFAAEAGVQSDAGRLVAETFCPSWLNEDAEVDRPPVRRRPDESFPAEPYLGVLKADRWMSRAQKEAVWAALTCSRPGTCLVALPTGEGKSLSFQLLARAASGLTVVVVPTVALAIDQYRSAVERLADVPGLNPRYFAADDGQGTDGTHVAQEVEGGRCRLVFTSPEACVSGRLRSALESAAVAGQLENLVVDEAHLIETWGIFFRPDFQMLSQLRARWVAAGCPLRTVLLSATFTPDTRRVLQGLFGQGAPWREFVGQRLRPEMTYFLRRFRADRDLPWEVREAVEDRLRADAVRDCAWRLPRPAIFYTTEVDAAGRLHDYLRDEVGFRRIGLFTGETRAGDRRELLRRWRDDEIDLMVATSAFGLGVDKPDVRAVVHACVPENLHRYYQEVGRGGRDGCSAACVLLPTGKDVRVARGLAPKLMDAEKIQLRWEAMWRTRQEVGGEPGVYRVRTDAAHEQLLAERTGRRNVDWNRRLVLQFVRARRGGDGAPLMELTDVRYEPPPAGEADDDDGPGEWVEWLTVRPLFPPEAPDAAERIAATRDQELRAAQKGLDDMEEYLEGKRCVNRILQSVYTVPDYLCGGCPKCRTDGVDRSAARPIRLEQDEPENARENAPELVEVLNVPDLLSRTGPPHAATVRQVVHRKGVERFGCRREYLSGVMDLLRRTFGAELNPRYRVDAVEPDHAFRIGHDEPIVLLHFGLKPDGDLLAFRRGRRVTHLYPAMARVIGPTGHTPLERDGAVTYASLESWLSSGRS